MFGTAALRATDIALLVTFPVIVWGADELRRYRLRRSTVGREKQLGVSVDPDGSPQPGGDAPSTTTEEVPR